MEAPGTRSAWERRSHRPGPVDRAVRSGRRSQQPVWVAGGGIFCAWRDESFARAGARQRHGCGAEHQRAGYGCACLPGAGARAVAAVHGCRLRRQLPVVVVQLVARAIGSSVMRVRVRMAGVAGALVMDCVFVGWRVALLRRRSGIHVPATMPGRRRQRSPKGQPGDQQGAQQGHVDDCAPTRWAVKDARGILCRPASSAPPAAQCPVVSRTTGRLPSQ